MMKYHSKGTISIFLVFIIFAIILIFFFGVGIPFILKFNSELYNQGDELMASVNSSHMPQEVQESLNASRESMETQVETLAFFFQYSWIIIMIVMLLVLFMISRQIVEARVRGIP